MLKISMNLNRQELPLTIGFYVLLILQATISLYWIWMVPQGDESLHIYNAHRVADGELPYRDFFSYLMPGTYLFGATVINFISEKIVVLRLAITVLAIAGIVVFYMVIRKNIKSSWLGLLLLTTYVAVTALSATYFSHHNLDNFLFLCLLWAILNVSYKRWYYYPLIGSVIALISVTHQAHGFYYFLAVIVYITFFSEGSNRSKILNIAKMTAPVVVVYIPILAVLIVNSTVYEFIDGVILWNLKNYAANLAFGPFEDTLYYINQGKNIYEQIIILIVKLLLFTGLASIVYLMRPRTMLSIDSPAGRLLLVVIFFFILGHIQTLHNAAAYYAFSILVFGVFITQQNWRWVIFILIIGTSAQLARFLTFPVRYHADYLTLSSNVEKFKIDYFYTGALLEKLKEADELLDNNEIKTAVVIGRSPEIYYLLGVKNPTRYDVILPVYLSERQIEEIVQDLKEFSVIDDKTLSKIDETKDFFDVHHYRNTPEKTAELKNSVLYSSLSSKQEIARSNNFILYK